MIQRALTIFLVATAMTVVSAEGFAAQRKTSGHKTTSGSTTSTPTTSTTTAPTTATPTTANVLVNWSAPTTRTGGEILDASELASFDIYYYDDLSGTIQTVHVADPSLRQWRISALPTSTTYHFSIVTTDAEGNASTASEIVSVAL